MALDESQRNAFLSELIKASKELKSDELVFKSEWIYDLPTQSLEIGGQMLHNRYEIPTGWNGYGVEDLTKLVELGFLYKIYESEEEPITFEKTIKYLIISDKPNKEKS
ncbi:hypothetical protein [Aquimarina sp. 2304DJ70-9]|uniref:hypothetical protein n=1 Tax=Aquimarina penaris TaxID=3231044 RepID=UPI0034636DF8